MAIRKGHDNMTRLHANAWR